MLERFYPGSMETSTYQIDFEALYREGYRGLIFDIDNTLVPHGAPADDRAIALFDRLKSIGFSCCLLSNNQLPRVKSFNDRVNVFFIDNAHKPSTIFIGDQLFTDVYGANRAGIRTILVSPIHPKEEIQIVLKRYLEKIVLYFYRRRQRKEKTT